MATVEVVTLNGRVLGVYATSTLADEAMEAFRASRRGHAWRNPSEGYWSSNQTTALKRQQYTVEQHTHG